MTDPSKSKFNLLRAEDEMNCQLDKHQQKNHTEWFECKVRPLPLAKASDQGVIHPPSRRRGPGDKLCTFNLRSVNTHQWDPTRGVEHRVEEKIPPPGLGSEVENGSGFWELNKRSHPERNFRSLSRVGETICQSDFFSNFLTRNRLKSLAEWPRGFCQHMSVVQ